MESVFTIPQSAVNILQNALQAPAYLMPGLIAAAISQIREAPSPSEK